MPHPQQQRCRPTRTKRRQPQRRGLLGLLLLQTAAMVSLVHASDDDLYNGCIDRQLTFPEVIDMDEMEANGETLELDFRWININPGFGDQHGYKNDPSELVCGSTVFQTRALGGTVPGPTLAVSPGTTMTILFRNKLTYQPESYSSRVVVDQGPANKFGSGDTAVIQQMTAVSPGGASPFVHNQRHQYAVTQEIDLYRLNKYNDPDVANLHFHGLHISAVLPSDDTTLEILPQQEYTYTIKIPKDHEPGLHWIHPDKHGSATLQRVGGAAMALIVKDPPLRTVDDSWHLRGRKQRKLQQDAAEEEEESTTTTELGVTIVETPTGEGFTTGEATAGETAAEETATAEEAEELVEEHTAIEEAIAEEASAEETTAEEASEEETSAEETTTAEETTAIIEEASAEETTSTTEEETAEEKAIEEAEATIEEAEATIEEAEATIEEAEAMIQEAEAGTTTEDAATIAEEATAGETTAGEATTEAPLEEVPTGGTGTTVETTIVDTPSGEMTVEEATSENAASGPEDETGATSEPVPAVSTPTETVSPADPNQKWDLPPEVRAATERILIFQEWDIPEALLVARMAGDYLLERSFVSIVGGESIGQRFVTINGKYQPITSIEAGVWERWRFLYAGWQDLPLEFGLTSEGNGAGCEFYLLAKDGIYIADYPRGPFVTEDGKKVPVPPGGRADFMVRCNKVGGTSRFEALARRNTLIVNCVGNDEDEELGSTTVAPADATQTGAHIQDLNLGQDETTTNNGDTIQDPTPTPTEGDVRASSTSVGKRSNPMAQLTPWSKQPDQLPSYLQDVHKALASEGCACRTTFDGYDDSSRVNGHIARPGNYYLHTSYVGAVNERILKGMNDHSYHQHGYPYQIIDFPYKQDGSSQSIYSKDTKDSSAYFKIGDWHDSYLDKTQNGGGDVTVRYKVTDFAGKMMIHCHNTLHSDRGVMQKEYIRSGLEGSDYCQCEVLGPIDGDGIVDDVNAQHVIGMSDIVAKLSAAAGTTTMLSLAVAAVAAFALLLA